MKYYFSLLLLFYNLTALSQNKLCPPSGDKKAVKYFESAREARKKQDNYKEVKEELEKSLEADSSYSDAWKLLGDAAYFHKDFATAEKAYGKAIENCPDIGAIPHYRLGIMMFNKKKYQESVKVLSSFLDHGKINEEDAKDAQNTINKAKLLMHPVPFDPEPLRGVSTADPEYLACISPDGDYCFFTRRYEMQQKGALTPVSVEKFMYSKWENNTFTKGEPMAYPFNKKQNNNEGSPTISIDNKWLYFTKNNEGNYDIYMSRSAGSSWEEPEPVFTKKEDNEYWESQPCVSPDGKTLYFVSIRDSVTQTSDIYISEFKNGTWSSPMLLDGPVNTSGSEKSPFLHPDNRTLYFSSNGLPGMGGYDIYMCRKDNNGKWGQPVNLGYPINTEADEVGFFVSTDGQHGYFASNNLKSTGGYDIFEFPLYKDVQPEKVLFVKGEITGEDGEGLKGADIEFSTTESKKNAEVAYDSTTGKFASVVLFSEDYILTIKKKGLAFASSYFSRSDSTLTQPKTINLKVEETKQGKAYKLNNILFETNSAVMNKQNEIIVEQFAAYLKINPNLKVSIYGHTDNEGNPADNILLSEKRARAVYDFLTSKGITAGRLKYKGFGETKPVVPNDTQEHKALNRRTEFYIDSM